MFWNDHRSFRILKRFALVEIVYVKRAELLLLVATAAAAVAAAWCSTGGVGLLFLAGGLLILRHAQRQQP